MLANYTHPDIGTVKLHHAGSPLNPPLVRLNLDEHLRLDFDDLADVPMELDYTIIHCTPDWEPSNLLHHDYATGFELNSLPPGRSSQGTNPLYTHHSLSLPNDDTRWTLSGNYVLRVVDRHDHDRIVLQRRFWVHDPMVQPEARVVQASGAQRTTGQRIELELDLAPLGLGVDPFREIVVCIAQNNQIHNARHNIKPVFVGGSRARYSAPDSLVFEGGCEHRNLVYRSSSYRSQQIAHTRRLGGETHVGLTPDRPYLHPAYTEQTDLNGRYLPLRDDCYDPSIEAEYAWFYFTLASPELPQDEVYLYLGEADAWQLIPTHAMRYSAIDGAYETRVRLKQGIYSYRYLHIDRSTGRVGHSLLEGNHSATENSYQIYVYHKPRSSQHWQLVGYSELKSR